MTTQMINNKKKHIGLIHMIPKKARVLEYVNILLNKCKLLNAVATEKKTSQFFIEF